MGPIFKTIYIILYNNIEQSPLHFNLFLQRREDDVQQHDSLRDTDTDAVEDQISSLHEYDEYSEREDRLVSLFRAQMSPELMQKYIEDMPCRQGAPRKRARIVTYSESASIVTNTKLIGLKTFTISERMLLDLYCKRGWSVAEGEEVLQLLRDPNFKVAEIRSVAFRNLLARLDRGDEYPEFLCKDMWVEEDGDQEVKMHFRDFKDAFLEILTDERIGAVDLFSQPRFDAQRRRWFTANANSGEWFEEAQAEVGPDTGIGAGLAFFDGAHILQNVGVNAAYGMSKHL